MTEARPTLLVVDDVESNIDVLLETLGEGYTIRVATNGTAALDSVKKALPDLILLDIMMPGMDGFEVCRRLKDDPATRDIPIIFISALNEDVDEARGLVLGAVDYIIKPFNPAIVLARVHNHLELKKHRDQLAALVAERTHELTEANSRLKALDEAQRDYLHAISHELRTPMNGILGVAELALDDLNEEQRRDYMEIYGPSRSRLLMALDCALLLAELQGEGASLPTVPLDLVEIVASSLSSLQEAFHTKELSIVVPQTQPVLVLGNEELLRQSTTTLLKTALKMATVGTTIAAQFGEDHDRAILQLVFQGQPLPDKLQRTFFDTFSYDRSSSCVEELGLAIPLAAHVIRAMGGNVDLRETSTGMEILVTLLKSGDQEET
ncbi:MAG: hybrid sensor histidine kinase/response regulator [Syntrophus sp. (in: bacteria)]